MGLVPIFCFWQMIKQNKKLVDLLDPVITAMGYELLGVEQISQGRSSTLRIYIDKEDGINVHDCQRVSHQVTGVLDVNDPIKGAYHLEVSSPGIDRPLFTLAQFKKFCRHKVKIILYSKLDGRKNFTGTIDSVIGEAIVLGYDDEEIEIPLDMIEKAHLVG
jgi:ribosome maturation factor RimP